MRHPVKPQHSVGIWIDHRKAVLVTLTPEGTSINFLHSELDDEPDHARGIRPRDVVQQRRRQARLREFYTLVIAQLHEATAIYLLGPGEAKQELFSELKANHLGDCIVEIETSDKLTDRQIVQKVQRYFRSLNVVQTHELAKDATVSSVQIPV